MKNLLMEHLHERSLRDADAQVIILTDNDNAQMRCLSYIRDVRQGIEVA